MSNRKVILRDAEIKSSLEKVVVKYDTLSELTHSHEFIEVVFFPNSGGVHEIDGDRQDIGCGDCVLINRGVEHRLVSGSVINAVGVINIIFPRDIFGKEFAKGNFIDNLFKYFLQDLYANNCSNKYIVVKDTDDQLRKKIQEMQNEFSCKNIGYNKYLKGELSAFITLFLRRALCLQKNMVAEEEERAIVLRVVNLIHENFSIINLKLLSSELSLRSDYLCDIFKKITGVSISKFIQRAKLEMVCKFLVETNKSIEEIMYEVGYSDRKNFFRVFKRVIGVTPLSYRKLSGVNRALNGKTFISDI